MMGPGRGRHINLWALLILIVLSGVTVGAVHLLHGYQMKRNIAALLEAATRDEEAGDLARAEENLVTYLAVQPEDAAAWTQFAKLMDRRLTDPRGFSRLYLIFEQAVRRSPEDRALRTRAAELALRIDRPSEALGHLARLWAEAPQQDSSAPGSTAQLAELIAQCEASPLAKGGASDSGGTSSRKIDSGPELPKRSVEEWYRAAIAADPHRISAYTGLANRLMQTKEPGKMSEAAGVLDGMVQANPGESDAYIARYSARKSWNQVPDPADAKRALELSPNKPEALQIAADSLSREGKIAEARSLLEKAERAAPQDPTLPVYRAQLEMGQDNRDAAIAILRQALERLPKTEALIPTLLAEVLIEDGQIEGPTGARNVIQVLKERAPSSGFVSYLDGLLLMRQGRWSDAVKQLTRASTQFASNPELSSRVALSLAACHNEMNHPSDRMAVLKAAASRAGIPAKVAYARALADSGNISQAIQEHLAVVKERPESQIDLARLLILQQLRLPPDRRSWDDVDRRIAEAERAVPENNVELILVKADALVQKGRNDEARALLEGRLALAPRATRLALALAALDQREGRQSDAEAVLDTAEKQAGPQLAIELGRLGLSTRAGGSQLGPALEKALAASARLSERDRQTLLSAVASTAYRSGERGTAIRAWETLAELFPNEPQYLLELGNIAAENGDAGRYRTVLEKLRPIDRSDRTLSRLVEANFLLSELRRGRPIDTGRITALADELEADQPEWWGASLLRAQLAEIEGKPEAAVAEYQKSLDHGNAQPVFLQRLVALLYQQNRFDEIDALAGRLEKQGFGVSDLRLVSAMNLIRKNTTESIQEGLAIARQVLRPDDPTNGNGLDFVMFARVLLAAGKPREAEASLLRAIELSPGTPDAWSSYVQLLVQTRQLDRARQVVQAARSKLGIEKYPVALASMYALVEDRETAAALYDQALKRQREPEPGLLAAAASFYANLGDAAKANPLLGAIVQNEKAPPELQNWARRTQSLLAARTSPDQTAAWTEALKHVESNLREKPGSFDDQAIRASLLAMRTSRRKEAIQAFEAIQARNELAEPQQLLLAMLYASEERNQDCEALIRRLLDRPLKDPRHLAFYLGFLIRQNRLEEADVVVKQLEEVDSRNPVLLEARAELLKLRQRDSELRQLLLGAADKDPQDLERVANLFSKYGMVAEAEAAFRKLGELEPGRAERWLPLVMFLASQDRTAESLKLLDSIKKDLPIESVAIAMLPGFGAKSTTADEKQRIESVLEEAISKKPDLLALQGKLALIRIEQGRFDEAEKLNRQVLSASPDDIEALNNLAWLLALKGPVDSPADPELAREASERIDRAIERAGAVPGLLDTRAITEIRSNHAEAALQDLRNAQALATTNPVLAWHLAWAQFAASQHDEARQTLQKALELGFRVESLDVLERPHARAALKAIQSTGKAR